ncbi:hypothetical protein POVWA2_021310 [Plasmodium ovale wallikeri]|uniref:Uncharacterized protein n=1 Tax=Plasmodium ovale wallikeri TaxID=864142 RepID=A0A1A8YRK3_PLAOA|nr:hypothetical protein POVWA1_021340 [Plasmodium ovale wallikeri]SBT34719.1 hypothetical protein POVWA2_021310 [Plasmodium ovale wallikeri]
MEPPPHVYHFSMFSRRWEWNISGHHSSVEFWSYNHLFNGTFAKKNERVLFFILLISQYGEEKYASRQPSQLHMSEVDEVKKGTHYLFCTYVICSEKMDKMVFVKKLI